MYRCRYCGRYLKEFYANCPGCGANKFEKIANYGTTKITTIPTGGYKINLKNLKRDNLAGVILTIMGTVFLFFSLYSILLFSISSFVFPSENGSSFLKFIPFLFDIPAILIGGSLLVFGIKINKKHRNKIKKIKKLANSGVLIKNLEYTVKPNGTFVNGQPIYCIEVMYENEKGIKIPFVSEGKYDGRLSRSDGTVDLLIDPNDMSNYFIDFEIY